MRRGRKPGKKTGATQRIRIWQNGTKLINEYWIDPDKRVIDVDVMVGWPSPEPELLAATVNYPAASARGETNA